MASDKTASIARDISTVCRCKAVKYKTIRAAIEQGADTLEKIREKTRANTGCGKSCTEKIISMIAEHKR
ncbi:MAG: (2Fe-2S)-binding protein [Oligoflexia bacterium]|nr:(2Fe-2S)-binding protein [Oligoflexia bacterium]MBF0365813.1 (2Fe-2S)-binding protein [Oligoflexia bacterium]